MQYVAMMVGAWGAWVVLRVIAEIELRHHVGAARRQDGVGLIEGGDVTGGDGRDTRLVPDLV